jgi:hypothetical protein
MPSCPAGHDSASTDFCDVCGLAIDSAGAAAGSGAGPVSSAPVSTQGTSSAGATDEVCPECGEPRTGRFCEGCSYDFVAGASGTPTVTNVAPAAPVATPVATEVSPAGGWTVVVSADRAYFDTVRADEGEDTELAFPAYCPDRQFSLAGEQVRIGRLSRSRGLVPEIDLTGPPADPGISHLHALLVAQADGGWAVVDPGSTNGTSINDDPNPIARDVAVPVSDGDRIHVGAWTTLTMHAPG